jgi:hypothetical protein
MSLPLAVRSKLYQALEGLPPAAYYELAWENDQRQALDECKWFNELLKASLQDFFAGESSDYLNSFPNFVVDAIGACRDYWIAFYALIQWAPAWRAIQKKYPNIATPGDALILAIEQACEASLQPIFMRYYRSSAHELRQGIKQQNLAREPALDKLQDFEISAIDICEKLAQKNRRTKEHLRSFKVAEGGIERELMRILHPRISDGIIEWREGILLYKT